MKNTKTFEEKYQDKLKQYANVFNLDDLNDANDRSLLEMMIKGEIMTDGLQEQIAELMQDQQESEEAAKNVNSLKKLHDLLKDATNTVLNIQRTLNIDRKTRKSEETTSVADYLRILRRNAKDFMTERRVVFWCPDCNVMVGRVYPVHDHTAWTVSFQCSQCEKMIRGRREQKDVLFDVKDRNWRKDNRAVIVQAKKSKAVIDDDDEGYDELYLGTTELLIDPNEVIEQHVVEDEVELFNGTNETVD